MENEKVEKILEVKIDTANAIKSMADLKNEIDGLKAKEAELNSQIKELSKDEAANAEAIRKKKEEVLAVKEAEKSYSAEMRTLSTAIQNQLKMDGEQVGSLKSLRAELSNATKEYDSLSRAEREGAKGKELQKHINEVTDELKNAEEGTQRYQRNVGNYENAIKSALSAQSGFAGGLIDIATKSGGVSGAMKTAGQAVSGFGKQLLALLANPIVLIISAIALAVKGVVDAFKSSEEQAQGLKKAFAPVTAVLDIVKKGFQELAAVVVKAVEGIMSAVNWIARNVASLFGLEDAYNAVNAEAQRYIELQEREYELTKRTREAQVQDAQDELKVSELRVKAKDKETQTDEERLAALMEANALEEGIAKRRKELAEEAYEIAAGKAALTENDKETNDELARLEAEKYKAEKDYNDKRRALLKEENALRNEMAAKEKQRHEEEKKRIEEQIKKRKEYNDLLLSEQRKAEDALLELISDNTIKLLEQENVRYQRMVDELAKAIEEKKALYGEDAAVIAEYQAQLVAAEIVHQRNIQTIQRQASEQHIADVQADIEREAEARRLDWENRIAEARLNGEDYNAIELEMLQSNIDNLHQFEEESDAEFKARMLAAQQGYLDKKRQMADAELRMEQAKASAIASLTGSLSGLLNEFGDKNKKLAAASKVLALAQIAIETGVAIAKGVSASQSVPFPANIAAVASTIATVLANITSAIATVKSAKFAKGGRVTGPGTSTSDSIPAMLSNGEYVLNARAYAMFPQLVEAINAAGSSAATPARVFNTYNTVSRAAAARGADSGGDAAGQTIVVSVEEINRVQDRVKVIENLSKIN